MLLTQKFHSLNEIDPEFIAALGELTHDLCPQFAHWRALEEAAPKDDTFIYWLFFGPKQNTPVGVAQVSLRKSSVRPHWPWWKKWRANKNWRIATWGVCGEGHPPAVFAAAYEEEGHRKCLGLMAEVEKRPELVGEEVVLSPEWPRPATPWEDVPHERSRTWRALRPFERQAPDYKTYLTSLAPAVARDALNAWKRVHKEAQVRLGDFPPGAARDDLLLECTEINRALLNACPGGLLTFQQGNQLLGFIHYRQGHAGTWFFEPVPLETQGQETVPDQLYLQYALLKLHELRDARHLVLQRQTRHLRLDSAEEEEFFTQQGFHLEDREDLQWAKIPLLP